ncbi:hypothetical protein RJT34_16559 [Clitoria ternatea]|uniref:Uncharacterized protein n=1 Tax=Clitoria ternatea TaxID=43366 RepID=A0AAN9J8X7_CLITE
MQALSGMIGRKASVGGFLSSPSNPRAQLWKGGGNYQARGFPFSRDEGRDSLGVDRHKQKSLPFRPSSLPILDACGCLFTRICDEYTEWVGRNGRQLPPQWAMPDLVRTNALALKMNGAKRSVEAVGCKNKSVGERSALEGRSRASNGGRSGSKNVGFSYRCGMDIIEEPVLGGKGQGLLSFV